MNSSNVPNLDAMTVTELNDFWRKHRAGSDCADLFPYSDISQHAAIHVTDCLAQYAVKKACAMQYRLEGRMAEAVRCEDECDRIYDKLPAFARW